MLVREMSSPEGSEKRACVVCGDNAALQRRVDNFAMLVGKAHASLVAHCELGDVAQLAAGNAKTYTVFRCHINCAHHSLAHAFIGNSQGGDAYNQLEELRPGKSLPVLLV